MFCLIYGGGGGERLDYLSICLAWRSCNRIYAGSPLLVWIICVCFFPSPPPQQQAPSVPFPWPLRSTATALSSCPHPAAHGTTWLTTSNAAPRWSRYSTWCPLRKSWPAAFGMLIAWLHPASARSLQPVSGTRIMKWTRKPGVTCGQSIISTPTSDRVGVGNHLLLHRTQQLGKNWLYPLLTICSVRCVTPPPPKKNPSDFRLGLLFKS